MCNIPQTRPWHYFDHYCRYKHRQMPQYTVLKIDGQIYPTVRFYKLLSIQTHLCTSKTACTPRMHKMHMQYPPGKTLGIILYSQNRWPKYPTVRVHKWLSNQLYLTFLQCLLMLLDSPLNKAGLLQIYIHTEKNVLIEINPQTRIPRTFDRFCGLMGNFCLAQP